MNRATPLNKTPEWNALQQHYLKTNTRHMREQFAQDPERFNQFSYELDDILFDFSKNRIDQKTISLLVKLADTCGLKEKTAAMFNGKKINTTEDRAVLHTALRSSNSQPLIVDGDDVRKQIQTELKNIQPLTEKLRQGQWLGATGKKITDIVNVGIGGSDLGPKMVTEALKPYVTSKLNFHFVANLDEDRINDTLSNLQPETTLFIICSKTFTTQETMFNAETARKWFLNAIQDEKQLAKHFIAVSTNLEAVQAFGIKPENTFAMWDWVGGRYSLWSAIGLSIMIAIGMDEFKNLLLGAYEVDQHFQSTPFEKNIPALMGLIGIWYNNFYQAESYAILPYPEHLHKFPSYLQQADMESNGKSVTIDGQPLTYSSGPILFGELGNPSQHAFYQLLHQGTKLVPIDVLAAATNVDGSKAHQDALISNVFAQTEALMRGKNEKEVIDELIEQGLSKDEISQLKPHKVFPGNRPSNTILFKKLDPKTLGSLVAVYEHKIFTQGVIWNINSFDQWGVELGKQLAKTILTELENDKISNVAHDSSTKNLIDRYLAYKN